MTTPAFALVDCNNFYASCERAFNPKLRGKALVVLSSNDGCVIARSNEAKALGVPMGVPFFKIKDLIKKNKILVFSCNFALYGDMSSRVMHTLSTFAPDMEVYSVDEAFLDFKDLTHFVLPQYGFQIKKTVKQWTGIPVSIGIAPTKTLAKVANHVAKKLPSSYSDFLGVCDLSDPQRRKEILPLVPIEDIWGVGKKTAIKLRLRGIRNAYELANASIKSIQKEFTITGKRLVEELQGLSVLPLEAFRDPKKEISSSRSFGKSVSDIEVLKEAVANFISRAAEKLRKQNSTCSLLQVYIRTSAYSERERTYFNQGHLAFPSPTDFTPALIKGAFQLIDQIYHPAYEYKKAGIVLSGLSSNEGQQLNLFESYDFDHEKEMMKIMDEVNRRMGPHTLKSLACGTNHPWRSLCELRSPRYTTRWSELLKVD